jgi:acyl carrier protein
LNGTGDGGHDAANGEAHSEAHGEEHGETGSALRNAVVVGVREVAACHLDWHDELPLEARLVEDLELDSIRMLTLATEVENRFQVILEPEDERLILTVADLVDAVVRKLHLQRTAAATCDQVL